jgi:hypothetical protein
MEVSKVEIGDYVTTTFTCEAGVEHTVTGIVYEASNLNPRIQLANGRKIRSLDGTNELIPATQAEIHQYQAEALEGMNPADIIAREKGEQGEDESGEDEDD